MIKSFKVRVVNPRLGTWVSDVYAVRDNYFLIYNMETGFFEWVDITEKVPEEYLSREERLKEIVKPCVTLLQEDAYED